MSNKNRTHFVIETVYQIIAVLALLVIINIYSYNHPLKKDLTEGKIFTLSQQTKQVFSNISEPVEVLSFFQAYYEKEGSKPRMRDLLEKCKILSKGNFTYRFVDPDKKPSLAIKHQIRKGYTTLFMCDGNETRIASISEEDVVNAVVKVTRGTKKIIYFLAGHGEADINDGTPSGLKQAVDELKTTQYDIKELHLYREEKKVPDDCAVLVLASPTKNLEQNEVKMISKYLDEGGSFLALIDPAVTTALEPTFEEWGINIGNNCVVDTNPVARLAGGGDVVMPVVSTYGQHPITDKFRLMTMFPYVRSVERMSGSNGAKTSSLLITTKDSWAEMSQKKAQFTPGVDKQGPICLGVASEKVMSKDTKTRIVVIGDSDFTSNRYYNKQGNGNFFQNCINWLAMEGNLISIKAKTIKNTPLSLTAKDDFFIMMLVLVIQPLLFLFTGFAVWFYRRLL